MPFPMDFSLAACRDTSAMGIMSSHFPYEPFSF